MHFRDIACKKMMQDDELLYRVSLTMIPDLGPVRIKALVDVFGSATAVFAAKRRELAASVGIVAADKIKSWKGFAHAQQEIGFAAQQKIEILFITDPAYPQRLLHCYDPPPILYFLGNHAPLNHNRIVSIIGTRNHTAYGKQMAEEFIRDMQEHGILTVSGLAFGIDSIAHKASLHYQVPTVGVLAHGLDTLYPSPNKSLAKEMLTCGGLLTEFRRNTQPDKHNFPRRNRIVAGMADATIVIETAVKGGSMITAALANDYNRDVFAVPGKLTDTKSAGCLDLIKQNKAILYTGVDDFLETMGWVEKKKMVRKPREFFITLSDEEQTIVSILQNNDVVTVDELYLKSGLSNSRFAAVMLNLELQSLLIPLPGKMFKLA